MPLRLLTAILLLIGLLTGCGQPQVASTTATPNIVAVPTAALRPSVAPTLEPTATAAPPTAVPTVAPTLAPTARPTAALDSAELHYDSSAPTAAPTAAGARAAPSDPARIVIEQIGMDRPLVPVGLDKNRVPIVPKHDAGWYKLSAQPGQGENVVVWGHVLRFKNAPNIPAPFARLQEVPVGTTIVVYTADGAAHPYRVKEQVWATPEQVEYILPQGREQLTLVSCIGDKVIVDGSTEMSHRLITIAEPVS